MNATHEDFHEPARPPAPTTPIPCEPFHLTDPNDDHWLPEADDIGCGNHDY